MNGSVEVRQFLLRYEGEGHGGGYGGVPAQRAAQESPRISDDQVRRARIAVAHGATGAEDCARLLEMLGLAPDDSGRSPVQH
ncbi:hypothetical protein [Saccharomonospora cyanea]|uniref:Uncharacterized protein n=1 Tax=Saccharomonospora cyanea NA-134 TaxID=882082 RepID=H5XMC9_9PSEU|nr:hypothetical protein [Saccharomonospora cyanea]EHR63680.1 hypothetical protein SaccyDRAFT_4882 [Saccharomonospora cyanea NA-134]